MQFTTIKNCTQGSGKIRTGPDPLNLGLTWKPLDFARNLADLLDFATETAMDQRPGSEVRDIPQNSDQNPWSVAIL